MSFNKIDKKKIDAQYQEAKSRYSDLGVDTDEVLNHLAAVPISINCWQGDDVSGFEGSGELSGGIMATGNYPGRARNGDELRQDADKVMSLLPGKHRFNLHAVYREADGGNPGRNDITVEHFRKWIDWAGEKGIGLDFNPTFFSHPKADTGFTLSSPDPNIRNFWIEHGKVCREVSAGIGKALGTPCVNNIWIPDGSKDKPVDRKMYREILRGALDEILAEKMDQTHIIDAVESKLFGIGAEAYTVGSHEFYLAYSVSRNVMLCLDAGHFHPTEEVGDKISSVLTFADKLLLHVSRPIRWDSDHVVLFDDNTRFIAREAVQSGGLGKIYFAVDFFDASINRIEAWVIGVRGIIKSLLYALLEPYEMLRNFEQEAKLGHRLSMFEELKVMPFGAVWDKYCSLYDVPAGPSWIDDVDSYEQQVLRKRS
ncbi:MAG: L-rhamnose isomerase [Spirochaetia bacterium]